MWVDFKPVKNKTMIFDVAEKLMRFKPVRVEQINGKWKLSIKIGEEGTAAFDGS